MTWRDEIEKLLIGSMPFAFKGSDGKKSVLDSEEFYDDQGALSYLLFEVEALMKKSFILGFTLQAEYKEVTQGKFTEEKPDFVFSPEAGTYWSEKAWLKAKDILDG